MIGLKVVSDLVELHDDTIKLISKSLVPEFMDNTGNIGIFYIEFITSILSESTNSTIKEDYDKLQEFYEETELDYLLINIIKEDE